jgi:hypothetical protein
MDIEDTIEELHRLAKGRGQLTATAVAKAAGLLADPRYLLTDDTRGPSGLLLADLKAAIARLPEGSHDWRGFGLVKADATALLITRPGRDMDDRWKKHISGGIGGSAVKWHRHFLLGRIAGELLELQRAERGATASYEVLGLRLGLSITYEDSIQHRLTLFEWRIQSAVPDMRWFGFTHNVHNLEVQDWSCESEGHKKVGSVPVRSSGEDGDHWYVVSLGSAPTVGEPVTIKVATHAVGPYKEFPWLSYTLPFPLEKLALTVDVPSDEATKFICQELDVHEVHQKDDYQREGEETMRYEPASPRKGRTYRLDWRT